jgi:hypothetical protein
MSVQRDSAPSGGTLLDLPSSNPGSGPDSNFDSGPGDYDANDLMREEGEPARNLRDEEEPQEEDGQEAEADDQGEDESGEQQPDLAAIEAPANWPDDARAAFAALPPRLQHHYIDSAKYMQADYTRKTQALAQERRGIQEINQIIGPRQQSWMMQGMRPAQAIGQLLALSDYADKDFGGFVKYLAQQRGIDLQSALGLNQNQDADEYIDPQVKSLQDQVSEMQQMLEQAGKFSQQQAQQQQVAQYQQAYSRTAQGIDQFAQTKNPDGTAKYPYFEHLEDDMAGLIEAGLANSIDDAYDKALHANPQTRRLVLQRVQAQSNEQLRKRAQQATRAASSISGAHANGAGTTSEGMSIRELLEATSDGRL